LFTILTSITVLFCIALTMVSNGNLRGLAFTYALMALAHWFIFRYADRLTANEAYRKWSEVVFWLPGFLWLII
jgi:preprotein translocase subunit SecD